MIERLGGMSRRLTAAWKGLARRERWLLGLLGVVALAVAMLSVADWSGRQREANAMAQADLAARRETLRLASSQISGPDASLLRTLGERSIKATDIWMARVAVEQYLATATSESGIVLPRIRLSETVEGSPDAPVLKAEITAPYDGAAVARLLERLASDPQAHFVDSLAADKGESAEFHLTLSFPVVLTARAPDA